MTLTPEKYEQLTAKLLSAESGDISDDVLDQAYAAIDEYEAAEMEGEGLEMEQEAQAQDLLQKLDPGLPIAPQVLATTPGTTHPGGDEAAKQEWLTGPLDNPAGRVIVYETPAAMVRQKLLENPQLGKTLTDGRVLSPDEIARIEPGSSLHQSYNDWEWKSQADAAMKGGKTAYRYSKAPWTAEGVNGTLLTKLKTSLQPGLDALGAFVMGHDNTANFGAGQAAQESGAFGPDADDLKYMTGPMRKDSDVVTGGVPAPSPSDTPEQRSARNDMLQEESPKAHIAGELGGAFSPWGVSGKLFNMTLGAASKAAPAGAGLARRAAAGAGGLAAGGAVNQAGNEAVDAATGGDSTLPERLGRVGDAAVDSLAIGGALGGLKGAAKVGGEWVREGQRYKKLPGQIERLGIKPEVGRGYADPDVVKAARAEGQLRPVPAKPSDVLAEQLDEPLRAAASRPAAPAPPAPPRHRFSWEKGPAPKEPAPPKQAKSPHDKPGHVSRKVKRAVSGKAEKRDFDELEELAQKAGGDAPEKLRGAYAAEPLDELKKFSSYGNPRGLNRSLLGPSAVADLSILRGIYPMTRKLEGVATDLSKAGKAGAINSDDEQHRKRSTERDADDKKAYAEATKAERDAKKRKRTPVKKVRRRKEQSNERQD